MAARAPSRLAVLASISAFSLQKRLGTPHLYEHVLLKDVRRAKAFAAQLAKQPALGQHVRSLLLDHGGDTALFQKTIAHTPALVSLHGGADFQSITWKAFCDLSESAGASLRSCKGIRVSKPRGAVSPEVFAQFTKMEEFEWVSTTEFKTERKLTEATAFGGLVDLSVEGAFDDSFSEVLAHMELPALRTTAFSPTANGGAAFFKKHGDKLQEVTASEKQINDPEIALWLSCPSMTVIGVSFDQKVSNIFLHKFSACLPYDSTPVSASCLTTPDSHGKLEHIVFRAHGDYRLKQADQTQLGKLMAVLRSTMSFPALREIEHPLCTWPTKERETKSSPWVKWAESLLERDVHLFGPDRVHWRQRLKYVPKGKQ
ncbi:Isocitrate dehydrogenase [Mycena sanguinolenta]|uniref:Isocitrate dehydrogenase n=1 Tax=Mycena sanguinolenta TaxID=230812 RepID=A0A8H6X844_9AGAR|nr:Isocitrate dehydrogenase [Mycena sanguinolenta]